MSYVPEQNYIPGILVICLSKQTVGNTQGDFLIKHDSEGIVVTPFKWFNSLAEEYGIVNMQRRHRIKIKDWNVDGKYPMNIFTIILEDSTNDDDLLGALNKRSEILFAEREFIYKSDFVPDDEHLEDQWYLYTIQAREAWDIQPGGSSDVVIGFIDTGILWNHEDLWDNMYENETELVQDVVFVNLVQGTITGDCPGGHGALSSYNDPCPADRDGNGYCNDVLGWNFGGYSDGNSSQANVYFYNNNDTFQDHMEVLHGTAVVGLASARGNNANGVAGVAYNTKILSNNNLLVNFNLNYYQDTNHFLVRVSNSVIYLVEAGVDIINCSFSAERRELESFSELELAIQYAIDNEVLVIAAAGNGLAVQLSLLFLQSKM